MPNPAVQEWLRQRHRRLHVYLRALLPGTDVQKALDESAQRMVRQADQAPAERLDEWTDGIACQVAAERRKTFTPLPFSDDLFRQLADSARPFLDQADKRAEALAIILKQLPPPERDLLRRKYELGLTDEQIARAEGRPAAFVVRDLTALRGSLVTALRQALPRIGPDAPGGAADLGRLTDQLIDGTITDDGRLVLETLLLADAAAQAHYHWHAALAADLTWQLAGPPAPPEVPEEPRPHAMTIREWVVTGAFVAAILAVAAFVVLRLTGHL